MNVILIRYICRHSESQFGSHIHMGLAFKGLKHGEFSPNYSHLTSLQSCMRKQRGVSLMFRKLSQKFSRNLCIAEIVLLVRNSSWTLYLCPKHGFGHMYKVSAWNSHHNGIYGIVYFCEIILESSRNISETTRRLACNSHVHTTILHCIMQSKIYCHLWPVITKILWNSFHIFRL